MSPDTTLTLTRVFICQDCGREYERGDKVEADSCCGRAVVKPPTYKDRVQVTIVGAKRPYTYLKGDLDLKVGDLVEVPLRTMNVLGTVAAVESEYAGVCRSVIRKVSEVCEPSGWHEALDPQPHDKYSTGTGAN